MKKPFVFKEPRYKIPLNVVGGQRNIGDPLISTILKRMVVDWEDPSIRLEIKPGILMREVDGLKIRLQGIEEEIRRNQGGGEERCTQ